MTNESSARALGYLNLVIDSYFFLRFWKRFVLRHSYHALKKKIPVRIAFITNIANKDSTTEAVVD